MLFVDYIKQVQSSNLYPYHEKKYETYKSYPILFFMVLQVQVNIVRHYIF